ncbi:MAG TPA: hypothetical protein PK772_03800 [Chitinophagaceae bacterium]|nr:hypothetical protein [Chitinophagaceae bacterium]
MQFIFKNKTYAIPASLAQITLGQRIDFEEQYGKQISERETAIAAMDEGADKQIEQTMYHMELLCSSFAFFSGIDIAEVKEHIDLTKLCNLFLPCFKQLFEQQQEVGLQTTYLWNDEVWELASPELHYTSTMSFNEFLTAKQVVKSLYDLGEGNWTVLQYLCAIFLRKNEEAFEEYFATPESERFKLMRTLPMDIALSVAFFLTSSSKAWLNNSPYLQKENQEVLI